MVSIKFVAYIIIASCFLIGCSDVSFLGAGPESAKTSALPPGDILNDDSNNDATPSNPPRDVDLTQLSPDHYVRLCEDQSLIDDSATVPAGSDITNLAGIIFVKASDLGRVDRVVGNLIVFGTGTMGLIDSVSNFMGNILVCGMNVGPVTNLRGNIIVVNGNIASVDQSLGNIIVIHGRTGPVTNTDGLIITIK